MVGMPVFRCRGILNSFLARFWWTTEQAGEQALDADDPFVHREITKCANDWFIRSYELSINRII